MRSLRDLQSLVYLFLIPFLVWWMWNHNFSWGLYLFVLALSLAIGVIHHNHTHLPIWKNKYLNRLTCLYLGFLQGHPSYVFYTSHRANHHRYVHGEKDLARTYQFASWGASGDSNHLIGYLFHPFQAIRVLYPEFILQINYFFQKKRGYFYYVCTQYLVIVMAGTYLAWLDWKKYLVLILIPQLHGLHWLLATNYLQHAHAAAQSENKNHKHLGYARNFLGLINPLLLNIGFHSAHHESPRTHWSELKQVHQSIQKNIPPQLLEPSLFGYMFRVYFLGIFFSRYKSQSLLHKE